jgi:hypothetical protein
LLELDVDGVAIMMSCDLQLKLKLLPVCWGWVLEEGEERR